MIRRIIAVICLFFMLCGQLGCYSYIEIRDRVFFLMIGVDEGKNGEYSFTFRQPVSLVQSSGQGSGSSSGGEAQTVIYHSNGSTLAEAISRLQPRLDADIFLGHIEAIIISDTVAKKGIKHLVLELVSIPETRRGMFVLISKCKAEEIVSFNPPNKELPSTYIVGHYFSTSGLGRVVDSNLEHVVINLTTEGDDLVAGTINVSGKELDASGGAVFREDRLVGWFSGKEIESFNLTQIIESKPLITIPCKSHRGGSISVWLTQHKSKIKPLSYSPPRAILEVSVLGTIRAVKCELKIDEKFIKTFSGELNDYLEEQLKKVFAHSRRLEADVFGIGRRFHEKGLTKGNREKWTNKYRDVALTFRVKSTIKEVGGLSSYPK